MSKASRNNPIDDAFFGKAQGGNPSAPPPRPPSVQTVEATISDDRTSDGTFEKTKQQWAALKPTQERNSKPGDLGDISRFDIFKSWPSSGEQTVRHGRARARTLSRLPDRDQDLRKMEEINEVIYERRARAIPSRTPSRAYSYRRERTDIPQYQMSKEHYKPASGDVTLAGAPSLQTGGNEAQWQDLLVKQSIGTMAKLLGIPEEAGTSIELMKEYISSGQGQEKLSQDHPESKGLTVHCVFDSRLPRDGLDRTRHERSRKLARDSKSPRMYLDHPRWRPGARKRREVLMGDVPVDSLERYLVRHPEFIFVTIKDYDASKQDLIRGVDGDVASKEKHVSESIIPASLPLRAAIADFKTCVEQGLVDTEMATHDTYSDAGDDRYVLDAYSGSSSSSRCESDTDDSDSPDAASIRKDLNGARVLEAPYLPIYHARGSTLDGFTATLDGQALIQFRLLLDHIFSNFEQEYAAVDSLVANGKICDAYLPYLFRPGMTVVYGTGNDAKGYKCVSELVNTDSKRTRIATSPLPTRKRDRGFREWAESDDKEPKYHILAWHWKFDNGFRKTTPEKLPLDLCASSNGSSERSIGSLMLRPLEFVSEKTSKMLQNRGQWFWKCRKKQIISYRSDSRQKSHYAGDKRYMIDMQVYQELHGDGGSTAGPAGSACIDSEQIPGQDFMYLSPLTIKGYNLKTKKWQDLRLDGFSEVLWNTVAFDNLVLNGKTKRLIQALISNQIEAEMSTDIISGKGNGLIMLLHGGPGTGKTLTAESVAEIAKRPLYPVTCGDIGTEPAAVERYLESVLHLGKAWGCVVLLDEADVFLEQRSLEDLHRNALVSVFLRVLEYYDGILVLTSNRVGTFDEAFKSRIQLAIHYTSLTTHQRTKIWENFLTRLEKLNEEGIDFEDLKDHVEKLAEHKMNGREIRNVITTARQFARWERKQVGGERYRLNYKVMEEVIETSGKFDKYIAKLNGGYTQDQLAEDEGLRLANGADADCG